MLTYFFLMAMAAPARSLDGPRSVPWVEDLSWSTVVDTAAERGDQPILIDFYAQWCGPCKLLDGFVYNEPEVVDELADVFTFKVDIDKPEYLALKTDFHITLLPTLIWCDHRGREIDRFTGAVSAEEFLTIIRTFRAGGNTFNRLLDLVAAKPEEPGLLLDLARRQAERGDDQQARILYRRLMNLRDRSGGQVVTDGMLGLASLEVSLGNGERAQDIARRAAGAYTEPGLEAAAGLMAIATFQGTLPDTVGMLETFGALIALDDTSVPALDAYARVATASGLDLEQASRYAIRAVVLSDDNPRMMATLAESYFKRGQYRKAVRWMEKAVEQAPERPAFQQQLEAYSEVLKSKPFLYRGRRR
jgi:thioredoxin-like negative regulator of GroEL